MLAVRQRVWFRCPRTPEMWCEGGCIVTAPVNKMPLVSGLFMIWMAIPRSRAPLSR